MSEAKQPSRRWHNLYWLPEAIEINGEKRGPGTYWAKVAWPDHDVAVSQASAGHAERERRGFAAIHMGAFPCDEPLEGDLLE